MIKINAAWKAAVKALITVWTISGGGLFLITSGYVMDVPVIKLFFSLLSSFDGWGIETVFFALGIGCIYYLLRHRQKSFWVSCFSSFLALCTIVGKSYEETGSWNCLFLYGIQSAAAVFVWAGYYFAYKHCILLGMYLLEKRPGFLNREPKNKLEAFLFEQHSFLGPFLVIFFCGLLWVIAFFTGTLQWDAWFQVRMNLGALEKTGHHPVFSTDWMGGCIRLGRRLFQSDSIGMFLYTGPQFLMQCLVFSYACFCVRKWRAPISVSWGLLLFWGGFFPFFPIWGYTMVKDSIYYIFLVLMVTALADLFYTGIRKTISLSTVLFWLGIMGVTLFRKEGRYLVALTLLIFFAGCRKYWKILLCGGAVCCLAVGLEYGYMAYHSIPAGSTGESLSVPLLQTARYLKEHPEDVTEEEREILERVFTADLDTVVNSYDPVISDGVKAYFLAHPTGQDLADYFKVWMQQLCRHPGTYVQTFLHHIHGYFYPNVHVFQNYRAHFWLLDGKSCDGNALDISFGFEDSSMRSILEGGLYLWEKIPVLGMLLSPGLYVYILLGECTYLAAKRKKEIVLMAPALCILAVCILSPVNAYMRYVLPLMALMPLTLSWCCAGSGIGGGLSTDEKLRG